MNDETATNGTSAACGASELSVELGDDLRELVSNFRKAVYEFGREHTIDNQDRMLADQRALFDAVLPLAALAVDAARYRWLRNNREVLLVTGFFGNGCVNRTIAEVDAAIDAAMKAPNG